MSFLIINSSGLKTRMLCHSVLLILIIDDDGNINPYATFNEMKQALKERSDMDDISLEKAEAQRAVSIFKIIKSAAIPNTTNVCVCV